VQLKILCFVIGVWLLQQQPALPSLAWAGVLALPATAWLLPSDRGRALRFLREAALNAGLVAAGFLWAAALAAWRLADSLPPEWEGRDVELVGVVSELPRSNETSTRFDFDVEQVLTPAAVVPGHVVLSWFKERGAESPPRLRAGERRRLTVRLKRPHASANPHGFDFEAWALERGIRAAGYVRRAEANALLDPRARGPGYALQRLRQDLRDRFQATLAGRPYAGVLVALAIGDQNAIPREQWRVFTRTGVNHLMSISGLHITMVSGLVFAIVSGLWRRSTRLALALPASKAGALGGALAAVGYGALAGFGVPAQRTVIMLAVVAAALWAGRSLASSLVLCLALGAVVLWDPWAVLAPGFWLSFGAVAIIFYVGAGRVGRPHWLEAWARVQWAVTLGLVPPLIALFQQVSLVSPLANVFAIPLVSLVVVPLTLLAIAIPVDALLYLAYAVLRACMLALEWLARLPEATWTQHAPPAWGVIAAVAGAAWLLLPRGFPARWVGAFGFLPLFLGTPPAPPAGGFRVAVLDVGQGLAAVVRTANHTLLYDAGPVFSPGSDAGNRVIVPYLRGEGVRALDGLILSHDDADHHGGALSLLEAVPARWLLTSLPSGHSLVGAGPRPIACQAGQSWEWDGVRFEVLGPPAESYANPKIGDNSRSCALRVWSEAGSALLAGDIEGRAEAELVARVGEGLRSQLVVAPHHGGAGGSSPGFVAAAAPRAVVFTAGYRNAFGHPRPEVVERYRAAGAAVFRSDSDGAVTFYFDGSGRSAETWRSIHRRYWQEAAAASTAKVGDAAE
jgi:competence protein ComEC